MGKYAPGEEITITGTTAIRKGTYFIIAGPLDTRGQGKAKKDLLAIQGHYKFFEMAVYGEQEKEYYVISDHYKSDIDTSNRLDF